MLSLGSGPALPPALKGGFLEDGAFLSPSPGAILRWRLGCRLYPVLRLACKTLYDHPVTRWYQARQQCTESRGQTL